MSSMALSIKRKKIFPNILLLFMVGMSTIVLYPFYFMIVTSLKAPGELFKFMELPSTLYWQNYKAVFAAGSFLQSMTNTIILVFSSLLLAVLFTSLASYPISRYNLKYFTIIYFFFLSGMIFSSQAFLLPQFQLIKILGLMNKRAAPIFIYAAQIIPMATLVFTGFIKSIPVSLEESAIIDGCGRLKMFYSIIFPLLKPATITIIATNIFVIWNDFLTPLLYIHSENKRTLILMIYRFQGERTSEWGPIFALCTMSTIPLILIFFTLQKYLVSGLMTGAIKG